MKQKQRIIITCVTPPYVSYDRVTQLGVISVNIGCAQCKLRGTLLKIGHMCSERGTICALK